ncbi:MAG: glycoside hydrolase family 31 protein [Clostridia bacterium]|nr:glycoside hydrolase family 31 protein [Clostridia bacterium]
MSCTRILSMLPGECWWGALAHCGHRMPLDASSSVTIDPCGGQDLDAGAPLFLSSKGRFLWSRSAFSLEADGGRMICRGADEIELEEGHGTLRGAYRAACAAHFPPSGAWPDSRFFSRPQYNTWMELGTDQTADAIVKYARSMAEHGMPVGILMIDEGWAQEYGVFEFNLRKIPDPRGLVDALHALGFSVMLWVTPLVAAAGAQFKKLSARDMLLKSREGETAIRQWWNGYSAVLDLTSGQTRDWFSGELRRLMDETGVDGFKFDAGDRYFYRDDDRMCRPVTAREQTRIYNELGAEYALNEFRAAWDFGGRPIVSRLQDKLHSWGDDGLGALIPNTIMQGLLGYAFCCPDMVGGGDIASFDRGRPLDGELFVRWAQASACMGMMQLSISPWRVLSREHAALVMEAVRLHEELSGEICALAEHARRTGEPIVRALCYVFADEGMERVNDCFMLGDDLLVCPVLRKGATRRTVYLPKGRWLSWRGEEIEGGSRMTFDVGLRDIPRFRRL